MFSWRKKRTSQQQIDWHEFIGKWTPKVAGTQTRTPYGDFYYPTEEDCWKANRIQAMVSKYYSMDPEKETVLFDGNELIEGMTVLIEAPELRVDLRDVHSRPESFENALLWNRWCSIVSDVKVVEEHGHVLVAFLAKYEDGTVRKRSHLLSNGWLVKKDSIPDQAYRWDDVDAESEPPKRILPGLRLSFAQPKNYDELSEWQKTIVDEYVEKNGGKPYPNVKGIKNSAVDLVSAIFKEPVPGQFDGLVWPPRIDEQHRFGICIDERDSDISCLGSVTYNFDPLTEQWLWLCDEHRVIRVELSTRPKSRSVEL